MTASTSTWSAKTRQFFEVPVKHEVGHCAEPGCSCGNAGIPKGNGYLYISQQVVDFREDCPTPRNLLYKLNKARADVGCFESYIPEKHVFYPQLICKQAAIRRQLSLEIAAKDAADWWKTGQAPLRSTPIHS